MFRTVFSLCAALCVALVIFHEAAGTPVVIPPLDSSGIPADVIWLHRFSWHVGSICMLAMGAMFGLAAFHDRDKTLAAIPTLMIAGYAVLALGLAIFGSSAMWQTPAPYIWPAFALISGAGLVFTKPRSKRKEQQPTRERDRHEQQSGIDYCQRAHRQGRAAFG